MSSWVVVPCLLTLRGEFDRVSPKRDKGADGTIADSNHTSSSDHTPDEDSSVLRDKDADHINEVHGLDIDSSGPWPDGWAWFDAKIKSIVAEEKRRWLDPNDVCRLEYVIWNRQIYSRSRDFAARPYTGSSDPHTNHAHFSARYLTQAESDTRPWGVYVAPKPAQSKDIDVALSEGDFTRIANIIGSQINAKFDNIAAAVLAAGVPSKEVPQRTVRDVLSDFEQLRAALVFPPDHPENVTSGMPADAPILKLLALLENPAQA